MLKMVVASHTWILWIISGFLVNVGGTLYRGVCHREGYFQSVRESKHCLCVDVSNV